MGPRPTAAPATPAVALDPGIRRLLPAILAPDAGDPDGAPLRRTTRDWLVDVVCFLLAVGVGALSYFGQYPSGPQADVVPWMDLLLGAAACLALWWRRRWPVAIALTFVPLGLFCTAAGGAILVMLFTVAVHRRFPIVALVAVLHAVTSLLYFRIYPDEDLPFWAAALLIGAVLAAIVAWGMFVRARRQLVLSLRDRALRAEAEQQLRVGQARETERARIAREMHDVLAHRISLLSMHAGALEFRPDAPADEVARAAGVIRASAHQALEDLREVIGVLRERDGADGSAAAPTRPQPTLSDLPSLLREARGAGMRVRDRIEVEDLAAVPPGPGRTAFRVVQEGLTNARKHAAGTTADVTVSGTPAVGLSVEVLTPAAVGSSADPWIPGAGSGLIGLSERATLASGRLEHGRTADGGFRLRAWLPWPT